MESTAQHSGPMDQSNSKAWDTAPWNTVHTRKADNRRASSTWTTTISATTISAGHGRWTSNGSASPASQHRRETFSMICIFNKLKKFKNNSVLYINKYSMTPSERRALQMDTTLVATNGKSRTTSISSLVCFWYCSKSFHQTCL